ncbi:MAG: ABC transporter permease subunit [Clostridia bacterium]|nr:ABC transporter permease subunit [Clostridia bacterium]
MPSYYLQNEENWKEQMKEQIVSLKREIENESAHYDKETIANMKAELETCEIALKNNINYLYYYDNSNWKINLLDEIKMTKLNMIMNENIQDEKIVEEKINLLEKNDFATYIEYQKQDLKEKLNNKEIEEEEYNDEIYLRDIQKKYEIYKENSELFNWKASIYQDISIMKRNLRTGINTQTGKLLNLEEIKEIEDNIKILEYRLENNIPMQSSGASGRAVYEMLAPTFSLGIISILMIMIAGSSISTEISKGTIKFLLFTPNKRWKVLLSKIISATIILIVLTIILSLISIVFSNLFFKEAGADYVYISSDGIVKSISNGVYQILYFLASSIDIFVYMMFAFMLSVITRNTALTVGISIACYIGSGIIMQIVNQIVTADWIKFIPFNNLGLANKIFANNVSYLAMQSASSFLNNVSITFSLAVLTVCIILMIITMFDSFNKRDIV